MYGETSEICEPGLVEDFGPSVLGEYQRLLWDTFEKPHK